MKSIHPSLFAAALVLNFLAVKIAYYLVPQEYYFTFSSLFADDAAVLRLESLALKLAIPFLVAAAVTAVLCRARGIRRAVALESRALDAIIGDQVEITLAFSAFMVALLMAWPYILLWDLLIDPRLAPKRLIFLAAYFVYFIGYALFARAGAEAAKAWFGAQADVAASAPAPSILDRVAGHPAAKPFVTALAGVVASGVSAFLAGGGGA